MDPTGSPGSHHSTSELRHEPWYLPVGDEVADVRGRLPGPPAGAAQGPDRVRQDPVRRAHGLAPVPPRREPRRAVETPLITVACHEDLTATDLVGRYLLAGDETVWIDGPLTRAVRSGALCYLDEVVEARKDTTVVVHALTDHRRVLPIEKTGELLDAHPDFLLVISYNPGYQSILKDLKPSTRQRFVSLEFDYPDVDVEATIIAHEGGVDTDLARAPGPHRGEGPQPQRVRLRGGREHPPADLRRPARRRRHRAAPRVRRRHRPGRHRRSRGPGGGRRHRRRAAAVTDGAAPDGEGAGVRLAEVQRVLALFAHGVAGRSCSCNRRRRQPTRPRER